RSRSSAPPCAPGPRHGGPRGRTPPLSSRGARRSRRRAAARCPARHRRVRRVPTKRRRSWHLPRRRGSAEGGPPKWGGRRWLVVLGLLTQRRLGRGKAELSDLRSALQKCRRKHVFRQELGVVLVGVEHNLPRDVLELAVRGVDLFLRSVEQDRRE